LACVLNVPILIIRFTARSQPALSRTYAIAAENSVPPMLIAAQSRRKSLDMFLVYSRRVDRYRNYSGKACP
jgi:hypothetical protein